MSKRFGRNQKRAMQVELSETKQRLVQVGNSRTYLGSTLAETQQEIKELQPVVRLKSEYERAKAAVDEVIAVLHRVNPDSPALQGCRCVPDTMWLAERTQFNMVAPLISQGPDSYHPTTYDVCRMDLYQLEVELRECEDFTDSMQFSVNMATRDGRPALAAMRKTAQAMLHMSPNQIARELAPYVKQALQERFA
jgi:hypothetical protein